MEEWRKPISRSERGEVGRVYYFNIMAILKNGEEWTKANPLTLNPDQDVTIEKAIRATSEVPRDLKEQLLNKRLAESKLTSGIVMRYWISEAPAPEWWNPTDEQRKWKYLKENRPVLYNASGEVI